MSSTNAKAVSLPVELIRCIFEFLSPCEIVQLRQGSVSKHFREISLDSLLWKNAYARAPLPSPSGPFPWQSTLYLERTLVQSELLSKTWMSQPAKLVWRKSSPWNLNNATTWNLFLGRCIWKEENNIYCRDINTGSSQLLYDGFGDEDFVYNRFPRTCRNGQRIYVVLTDDRYPYRFLKLLELDVSADGQPKPKIWDLLHDPQRNALQLANEEHQHHLYDPSPFLILYALYRQNVVLDLRTHGVYSLHRFTGGGLDEFRSFPNAEVDMRTIVALLVPTRTHIVAFQVVDTPAAVLVLIQAFVAPNSLPSRSLSKLRLTHHAVFYDDERFADGGKPCSTFSDARLLRNSVVDPVTKSVNIKILYASKNFLAPTNARVAFLDLTLPAPPSSSEILPIRVRREHLFESSWVSQKFTASEDGYARGIHVSYLEYPHQIAIRKFTIDANGDGCTAEFGEALSVSVSPPIWWDDVMFDGVTGKLYYFNTDSGAQLKTVDIM